MTLRILVGCKRAIDYAVKVLQDSVVKFYIKKLITIFCNERFK